MKYQIISSHLLAEYRKKQKYTLSKHVEKLRKEGQTFAFAFTRSSVFSSMIEGSSIDLDNYLFNKDVSYQSREMQQVDDLIKAYEFAKAHIFSKNNVLKVHKIMAENFAIPAPYKGGFRDKEVSVRDWEGKAVYKGCAVSSLQSELNKLLEDISHLNQRKKVAYNEAFYYAAYIHLVFVNIHPFADGNGRMARLIEKWVLSELLDDNTIWKIPGEINYWIKREKYHTNMHRLGVAYKTLDYSRALPFLLMLPTSFGISKRFLKSIDFTDWVYT